MTELVAPGAAASEFIEWFTAITVESNRDQMERACPDHFVLRTVDGIQEVVETNGGSPLAARFTIDYDDVSSLVTPIDPLFPHRLDGVARATDGTPIGGVRHQFRDTPAGVHARLVVEFPMLMLRQSSAGIGGTSRVSSRTGSRRVRPHPGNRPAHRLTFSPSPSEPRTGSAHD